MEFNLLFMGMLPLARASTLEFQLSCLLSLSCLIVVVLRPMFHFQSLELLTTLYLQIRSKIHSIIFT